MRSDSKLVDRFGYIAFLALLAFHVNVDMFRQSPFGSRRPATTLFSEPAPLSASESASPSVSASASASSISRKILHSERGDRGLGADLVPQQHQQQQQQQQQQIASTEHDKTAFDQAYEYAYDIATGKVAAHANNQTIARRNFHLATWTKRTRGGLLDKDRIFLAKYYRNASSVFEFGLGESSYIADHVGVPRFAGVDSDAIWVTNARDLVSTHFRFYFADVGKTLPWGYPEQNLQKRILDYQIIPLFSEPEAFDVYLVDGRFRVACLLMSFLHASARGADASSPDGPVVLMHDCQDIRQPRVRDRRRYHVEKDLIQLVDHSDAKMCAFKRRPETTDEQLYELWMTKFMIDK